LKNRIWKTFTTFVWRKTVENNKVKLESKIRKILEQIEEGIVQDNQPDDQPPSPIDSKELKRRIAQINREKLSKEEKKKVILSVRWDNTWKISETQHEKVEAVIYHIQRFLLKILREIFICLCVIEKFRVHLRGKIY
jgi:hypothetical protein